FIQRCCQLPFLSLQLCNLLRCFDERLCFLPTLFSQFVDRFGLCIYATGTVSVAFCFVGHNVASSNLYLRLWALYCAYERSNISLVLFIGKGNPIRVTPLCDGIQVYMS